MTEPRWTIDEDGWLISPSGRTAIASWDHDDAEDASARIRADEFDALVAAVRDAQRLEVAEAERDAAREELAEKWDLYRACNGAEVYEVVTPRINKLYMALNARARGDENDYEEDPAEPWNRLVELTATAVLRWIVANRWAVNEHQRVEHVEAERDRWRDLAEALAAANPGLTAEEFAAKYPAEPVPDTGAEP